MDWSVLIGPLAGLITAVVGGGGVSALMTARYKHKIGQQSEINKQVNFVLTQLSTRLKDVEKNHGDCTKENADLREEVGKLRAENKSLRSEVTDLRHTVVRLEEALGAR